MLASSNGKSSAHWLRLCTLYRRIFLSSNVLYLYARMQGDPAVHPSPCTSNGCGDGGTCPQELHGGVKKWSQWTREDRVGFRIDYYYMWGRQDEISDRLLLYRRIATIESGAPWPSSVNNWRLVVESRSKIRSEAMQISWLEGKFTNICCDSVKPMDAKVLLCSQYASVPHCLNMKNCNYNRSLPPGRHLASSKPEHTHWLKEQWTSIFRSQDRTGVFGLSRSVSRIFFCQEECPNCTFVKIEPGARSGANLDWQRFAPERTCPRLGDSPQQGPCSLLLSFFFAPQRVPGLERIRFMFMQFSLFFFFLLTHHFSSIYYWTAFYRFRSLFRTSHAKNLLDNKKSA